MPFKFEFADGTVRAWTATGDGSADCERIEDYHPTIYVRPPDGQLEPLAARLAGDPKVVDEIEREPAQLFAVGAEEALERFTISVPNRVDRRMLGMIVWQFVHGR